MTKYDMEKKGMRVLYFMNHVDQGGAALALYDLIVELKKMALDYEPIVVTGKHNDLNRMLTDINVENYSADFKNFLSSYKKPFCITRPALRLRYEVGKRKGIKQIENVIDFDTIDVIHSNLNRIDIGALLAQKYNKPHLWHIREHANLYTGLFKSRLVSGESKEKGFDLISVKRKPIEYMAKIGRACSEKRNYYIAISESIKREWMRKGIPSEDILVIYDGIKPELYKKKEKNNSKIKMILLGGYCQEKGQEELIESLGLLKESELNKIQLDMFGNGEESYVKYLKGKAEKLMNMGIVSFHGYDSNIAEKLSNYDIGVNCSCAEGFGRVIVEYMVSGLYTIASNTGASKEIIDDGVNGMLYRKGDTNDLAKKISYCINNQDIIRLQTENAIKKAKSQFTIQNHAQQIMSAYRKVIIND